MADDRIRMTRDKRTHFTYYGITPIAVLQLREFSRGERDFAEGDGFTSLRERKLCDDSGRMKVDREQARGLVSDAYREGWHEKYE